MQFEKVNNNDLKAIRSLQPEGWPDIVPEFEFYINSSFCNPIKTKANQKIVGIGALIDFGSTSWIAHIIVDKAFRRRGIGFMIVGSLIKNLKNDSIDTCLLIATDLGQPIYEKAGFRFVSDYIYLTRAKPWMNLSISENVIPFRNEFYSIIIDLDNKISGENRKMLLKDKMTDSMVFMENNVLKGYYLPNLGEGLIIADTVKAGIELMKVKFSSIDKAVLPAENNAGIDFLLQNGFVQTESKGTRMILGKDIVWKPENIFSRIGGNFG